MPDYSKDHAHYGEARPIFSKRDKGEKEYLIQVKDTSIVLTPKQAASLLYQMLRILPDVPFNDRLELLHMRDPQLVYVERFKAVNGEILPDPGRSRVELRILTGNEAPCDPTTTHDCSWAIVDPVSYKAADNAATLQIAEAYCREQGITLREFMRQAKEAKKS